MCHPTFYKCVCLRVQLKKINSAIFHYIAVYLHYTVFAAATAMNAYFRNSLNTI